LAALRANVGQFAGLEARIAGVQGALAEARAIVLAREGALEASQRESAEAAAAMELSAQALKEAEEGHEQAFRHDLVGTLTRGKRVGDPCPVCDRPLEAVSKVDSRELARVKKVLDRAKEAARQSEGRWGKAERDAALAEREVQIAHGEVERIERDLEALGSERSVAAFALEAAFGGELPSRPEEEVDARLSELRARRARVEQAESAAREARDESVRAREASTDLVAKAAAIVGTLRGLPIPVLLRKAHQSVPDLEVPAGLVAAIPGQPGPAMKAAQGLVRGLADLAEAFIRAAGEARSGLDVILDRARGLLPDGMPKAMVTDIDDLLEAARTSAKDLVEEATDARRDAERVSEQLKERKELEQEIRGRSAEAAVFHALAGELRADRLITFLQGEALELLAEAGSERLLFLSQGRYRLAFEGDEFYVEDRQNGDERRSVKTLSGGETFLASLALALALSEQIQSLAVTSRARLESLFIDEGFGALDPESLEIATEALSQLGGHDRMVGVITHVSELAERLPVRIEVRKLPGGSRLEVVA
jgi:exonuclease SbcC